MFEKEATEYALEWGEKTDGTYACCRDGYLAGAEFGYKKANDKIEALEERCEIANDEIIRLQKANEWHEIESKVTPKREISKQYMPKNKEKVLLKYHFSGDDEVHISDGYYDAYDFEFHIANNPKYRIVCVIAWKEIVLPKESE